MADGSTGLFSFLAGAPSTSALSYPAMEARRKIALQMLANSRKGYPKTFGEGLTAIGDAIGDIGMMRGLSAQEAAYQKQAAAAAEGAIPAEARTPAVPGPQTSTDTETDTAKPTAYADETATEPAVNRTAAPIVAAAPTPAEGEPGVTGPGYNALDAAAATDPWMARSRAIAGIETGGEKNPYTALGTTNTHSGDRAHGKYQIMGANIPSWTQAATGQALTPQQFLASPAAQEATFRHRFGNYVDKYGEEGAARAWYAGEHGMNKLNATDLHERLSVADYGRDFMNRMAPYNRDRVAAAVTPQPDAPPQAALPLSATTDQPADLPLEITRGFSATPQAQAQIRTAPPLQMAQATPQPAQAAPVREAPPTPTPMGDDEKRGYRLRAQGQAMGDPGMTQMGQGLIDFGVANRQQRDAALMQDYRDRLLRTGTEKAAQDKFIREGGAYDVANKAAEADIGKRTGMTRAEFYPMMDKEKASIDQTVRAQDAQRLARKAIKDGVITGYGANMKIATAKFADWAFNNGMKGDLAANTEIMQSALTAGLSEAVKTINGEGGTGVSNTDVRIAQGMAGTDPNLQMKTIQSIMDRAGEINNRKINRYEEQIDKYLSGHPQELRYAVNARPTAPPDHIKTLLESQKDADKADSTRAYFDKTYGPGAAELEIARFKRTQRRQGGD